MLVYLEPGAVLTTEQTSRLREAWAARSFERALGELANVPRSEELRGAIPARVRLADDLLRHGESLASAAGRLGLSVGRFSHVVADAVGAPPSRLRAWHRLRTAVRAIAGGASATEAAHFAGYSDSAHFSRHCRATLAVTPTMLRRSDLTLDEADAGSVA
jgi:AraC-like DNA-binding protein